jgi:predicted  nucleic acid-binding Zn-ribbon protein
MNNHLTQSHTMMLQLLSKTLKELSYDVKKARWRYDGAVISVDATQEEKDMLWDEYNTLVNEVGKIEGQLQKIEEAKVNVSKARWWLDVGVHSHDYSYYTLPLIYPFDSLHTAETRRSNAVTKAKAEYEAAKKVFDELNTTQDDKRFIQAVNEAYSLNNGQETSIPTNSVRAGEMLRRRLPMPRG